MFKKISSNQVNPIYIFAVVALVIIATIVVRYTNPQSSLPTQLENQETQLDSQAQQQTLTTEYSFTATEDGQTALELIEENADIETVDYGSAGKFVSSINGLAGDNQNYWAFYLNGEYAQAGASQTILQKDDVIKFVYEEVSLTQE